MWMLQVVLNKLWEKRVRRSCKYKKKLEKGDFFFLKKERNSNRICTLSFYLMLFIVGDPPNTHNYLLGLMIRWMTLMIFIILSYVP